MSIKTLQALNNNAPATETTAEVAPATFDAGSAPRPVEPAVFSEPPARKRRARGLLLGATAIVLIAAGAYYGHDYWTVGRFEISTDDAYVKADSTTVAPKVSGYLSEVLVMDNQTVKAGQPLARIDDRDFRAALDQAKADVAAAEATINAKQASLDIQQSAIASARATLDVDKANETFAEQNNKRYTNLATSGYAPVQTAQQAASAIAAAQATIVRDTAALDAAVKQVALLNAELAQARATLAHDQAVARQAELNLSYATIVAPVDGTVGNRTLRVGQYVQAGTQLMAVVPTTSAYIVANYKETQLTDVHAGQPVDIEVDMFPGRTYHGHVDSLAPASGQEFALLPPDNATGNFTKVVQRIPVKIVLDGDAAENGDLRPGMSVQPSIDTKNDRS
ncbi:HlyD family secretion protein [Rhizobium binae]|uniref:Membrane fusion protein (Multidrug efflux system) n=1 Tax=Rhizobium binae TaxID=1138190 RepID=A0ABV2MI63_9HYPH|nr:HlyD family secretion protein [Rhizobium binae]NKL48783.1 HlyD family efflux transporter periplasmic adaptor subunit [Rhizobium leguminosarum bv. viciae]MBX4936297.1 HlyD family secretion protein [Rhizobium binae]MBX4942614.1 HlyD family secretion protein [Rhizobium binae]MBX4950422.1 HlyD family secretion protein [Rhizobium binae]MBX4960482.1 HlyD family secretion protein [Rhizobium binae]